MKAHRLFSLAVLCLLCSALTARAAPFLVVHVNGETRRFDISQIASLTFQNVESAPDVEKMRQALTGFRLFQNYPNPFNSETRIEFDLDQAGDVKLTIYDLTGREIATLCEARLQPGRRQYRWDGRDSQGRSVSAGCYLYRLTVNGATSAERMILVK